MRSRRSRGRPIGFKLSEHSKEKIRQCRLGTRHSESTKEKISRSLKQYFKHRDRLSDTVFNEYRYYSPEVLGWIDAHQFDIDDSESVLTNKRLVYINQMEVCMGLNIYDVSHNATPEFFLLLKEELRKLGMFMELKELESLM